MNEINKVVLEGDFLPGGTQEFDPIQLASVAGPGTENSSVFDIEIGRCEPESSGMTEFWVIVESAGINGATYGQGLPSMYPDQRRAAFMKGSVGISGEIAGITVTSIDPDHAPFLGSVSSALVSGSGFENGATVELRQVTQTPVPGSNVAFIDPTHIQCDLDLKTANSGKWDVVVINPDLQEGVLIDGFTIEQWSDELSVATGYYRLPGMAESMSGTLVLVVGDVDETMKFLMFDPSTLTWDGPYLLNGVVGNNMVTAVAADTQSDAVYFVREGWYDDEKTFRWTGGTGEWEKAYHPVAGCRTMLLTVDPQGWLHIIDNTISQFGHIYHFWAETWDIGYWGWHNYNPFDEFPPINYNTNKKVLSEGNEIAYDSAGTMYTVYGYDLAFEGGDPAGPRSVMVAPIPLGGVVGANAIIQETSGVGVALDSPAIACLKDDTLHAAYREYDQGAGTWAIRHEESTDTG